MASSDQTVLVTGGSGFLGSHCLLQALQQGYRVRTTVRRLDQSCSVRRALRRGGATASQANSVLFFATDLAADDGWDEACAGCDYILHVAAPVPAAAAAPDDAWVVAAREATLRVLRAARKARTVRRVVLTSSVAAIAHGHAAPRGRDRPFTERDWTDVAAPARLGVAAPARLGVSAEQKSKTVAERAAWDFMRRAGAPMELSVVNPAALFGPVLGGPHVATSLPLARRLLDPGGSAGAPPAVGFGLVDVRDAADLHLRAMTHPRAAGERFIAQSDHLFLWPKDVARMLRAAVPPPPDAMRVAARAVPDWLARVVGRVDAAVAAAIVPDPAARAAPVSNQKAKDRLQWRPRSSQEAIWASARSLREHGLVK